MTDDPIAGIQGGVVGLGMMTKAAGKIPIVGPEIAKLGGMLKGGGKDFDDSAANPIVGAEGGAPIEGAAGAGAGLGELAELAPLAAL